MSVRSTNPAQQSPEGNNPATCNSGREGENWITDLTTGNRFALLQPPPDDKPSPLNASPTREKASPGQDKATPGPNNTSTNPDNVPPGRDKASAGPNNVSPGPDNASSNKDNNRPGPVTTPRQQAPPAITITLVGDSLIRGAAKQVAHGDEFEAREYMYRGRTARQINGEFRKTAVADVTVIQAGTNNMEKQPIDQCVEEIRQLIDNVSRKRSDRKVIMATIPHRYDEGYYLNKKIDKVNDYIRKEVSKQANWRLLQHELLSKDYRDGLHFNERGTAKFALEIRHIIRHEFGQA